MGSNGCSSFKQIYTGTYADEYEPRERVALVKRFIDLSNKIVLDLGCGQGRYAKELRRFASHVYCLDVEKAAALKAKSVCPDTMLAAGEYLPFPDDFFDVVFMNDVLEHVGSDEMVMKSVQHILKNGGYIIISIPNRLFPFEVHGLTKLFRVGHAFPIPLVNYLPDEFRNKLVSHVRAYTAKSVLRLLEKWT